MSGSSGLMLLLLHLLLSRALLLCLEGLEGREGWESQGLQAVRMLNLSLPKWCNLVYAFVCPGAVPAVTDSLVLG